jgi:hypothetical protein
MASTNFTEDQSKDVQLEAIGEECKQLILSLPKEYGFGNQYFYFFKIFGLHHHKYNL